MIRELRRRALAAVTKIQIGAFLLFFLAFVLLAGIETHAFTKPMSDLSVQKWIVLAVFLLLGTIVLPILLGRLAAAAAREAMSPPPGPIAGAPVAILLNADGSPASESIQTLNQSDYPASSEDGWITVQLQTLAFPPVCVSCMRPTDQLYFFRFGKRYPNETIGRPDVPERGASWTKIGLPLCNECLNAAQRGRPAAALLAAMIWLVPGLVAFSLIHPRWVSARIGVLAFAVPCAIACAAYAWGLAETIALPVHLRRFSNERNTIQLRFTNPRFMKELIEASHSAEVESLLRLVDAKRNGRACEN